MDLNDIVNNERKLYNLNNYNLGFDFNLAKNQMNNIVYKLLDKGSEYVIKSLPVPDLIKNVITDIKDSVKKDGFKKIVSTAIDSSIEEGLQILNLRKDSINTLNKLFEVANKGGLFFNLEAGVDILKSQFCRNRIVPRNLDLYFKGLNNYILSNEFANGIKTKITKQQENIELYLDKCTKWYKAYSNYELEKANVIAEELENDLIKVKSSRECKGKNEIIQNVMKLTNSKNDKITDLEFKLCHNFA